MFLLVSFFGPPTAQMRSNSNNYTHQANGQKSNIRSTSFSFDDTGILSKNVPKLSHPNIHIYVSMVIALVCISVCMHDVLRKKMKWLQADQSQQQLENAKNIQTEWKSCVHANEINICKSVYRNVYPVRTHTEARTLAFHQFFSVACFDNMSMWLDGIYNISMLHPPYILMIYSTMWKFECDFQLIFAWFVYDFRIENPVTMRTHQSRFLSLMVWRPSQIKVLNRWERNVLRVFQLNVSHWQLEYVSLAVSNR